jgi:hypothetical protein
MASFESTLRLNMLEIVNYSKSRKNRKRYSLADVLGQLHSVYQLSDKKPSPLEIADALEYLKDRGLVEETILGSVEMYYINDQGRDLLQRISEGDDTAII